MFSEPGSYYEFIVSFRSWLVIVLIVIRLEMVLAVSLLPNNYIIGFIVMHHILDTLLNCFSAYCK